MVGGDAGPTTERIKEHRAWGFCPNWFYISTGSSTSFKNWRVCMYCAWARISLFLCYRYIGFYDTSQGHNVVKTLFTLSRHVSIKTVPQDMFSRHFWKVSWQNIANVLTAYLDRVSWQRHKPVKTLRVSFKIVRQDNLSREIWLTCITE